MRDKATSKEERQQQRQRKLERLRDEVAKGEADIAAGRYTAFDDDDDLKEFFAKL